MSKIAFVYPGQGAQHIGMGKSLYENFPLAKEIFDEADSILGFELKRLCFEGGLEELTKTENTQPAVFVTSYAAYRVLMTEAGIRPFCSAGHSLGEITALACAEAIRFSDAVRIVRERGRLMQEASSEGSGIMAAVSGVDKITIGEECEKVSRPGDIVGISNYNSPMQIVISGNRNAVEIVCNNLKELGGRTTPLKVSAPFHSPIMAPAAAGLETVLRGYSYAEPEYEVISNVDAKPYAGAHEIITRLKDQMVKPVRWQESMKYFKQQGIDTVIEIGPNNILKKLMAQNIHSINAYSCEKDKDVYDLKDSFGTDSKPETKDHSKITVVTKCLAIAVCTKNNNWDNKDYEQGVILPYNSIQKLQEKIENEKRQPETEEMKEAIKMLKSVFDTKGTPRQEQSIRFKQIYEQTGTKGLFHDLGLL